MLASDKSTEVQTLFGKSSSENEQIKTIINNYKQLPFVRKIFSFASFCLIVIVIFDSI